MKFSSSLFFLALSLLVVLVGMQTVSASCDTTGSMSSASEFLLDCAQGSTNAVNPANFAAGKDGTRLLVISVAEKAMQFGALFAVGAIVFAGLRYIASAGDDEKLKSAKNTWIYALIGLILILTAFPFVDLIIGFFYSLGS